MKLTSIPGAAEQAGPALRAPTPPEASHGEPPGGVAGARQADMIEPAPGSPLPRAPREARTLAECVGSMAVTRADAALADAGVTFQLYADTEPHPTVSVRDILSAAPERREELLRRYHGFVAAMIERRVGDAGAASRDIELADGPFTLAAQGSNVRVTMQQADGGVHSVEVDLTSPSRPLVRLDPPQLGEQRGAAMGLLLQAFEHLLVRPRPAHTRPAADVDRAAAKLFMLLLGPGGALNPQGRLRLPPAQRFLSPKLVCWDLNGTVERGHGAFRPDMRDSTRNLNRMGALSVITTTIAPESAETLLQRARIPFNGYFGGHEVRPDKGNKRYTGVAAAFGIAPREAPDVMAVIGDSATDIPRDLPGVLFIHNDADTPAEAIQIILHELDRRGDGSLAAGARALLEGAPADVPVPLSIGPIRFLLEVRDGGTAVAPSPCPVIFGVHVDLSDQALVDLLATRPPAASLDERALYGLGLRFIEGSLDARRLPALLPALAGAADLTAVLAAGRSRLEQRAAEIDAARDTAARLEEVLAEPLPFDKLVAKLAALAAVGDAEVTDRLEAFITDFSPACSAAAARAEQELDGFAEQLRGALATAERASQRLVDLAAPLDVADAKESRKLLARLHAGARDPVPLTAAARKCLLETLAALGKAPLCGAEAALAEIAQSLDATLATRRVQLATLAGERQARATELSHLSAEAARAAHEAEALWREVEQAWSAVAAGA